MANGAPRLPDADSHAFTTGFGYDITKALTIDFAYGARIYNDITVSNSVVSVSIRLAYEQLVRLLVPAVTYKF